MNRNVKQPDPDAPLMLGVSGLRGLVGRSLTPELAVRYAQAFAAWLIDHHGVTRGSRIVVGRDSRPSGEMIEAAVVAGLLSMGLQPRRAGVVSTPGVAGAVQRAEAAGGLIITASHNPAPWNGVKPIRHDATAPPAADAQLIIDAFHRGTFDLVDAEACPRTDEPIPADRWHVDAVLDIIDADAIKRAGLTAAVDATRGAGGPETRALLDALGVEATVLYAEPTGEFPHPPEPQAANLGELCEAVSQQHARVGFAIDPDADRLALVDETGRYIGEEYTLALAARRRLRKGDVAVANLSTSRMIDDAADAVAASVVRTPVGEANVAEAMREHRARIGGEGNGGVIVPGLSWVRDSLASIALVLELLAADGRPLSEIVDALPSYAIRKDKRDRPADYDPDAVANRVTERFPDAAIDTRDGVRVDWPDRWLSLRASNTEPILRLIAESPTVEQSDELLAQAATLLDH